MHTTKNICVIVSYWVPKLLPIYYFIYLLGAKMLNSCQMISAATLFTFITLLSNLTCGISYYTIRYGRDIVIIFQ